MKRLVKVTLIIIGVLFLILVVSMVFTEIRYDRNWDSPYPQIVKRTEPEILSRGEYLVWNVIGCAKCHLPNDESLNRNQGDMPPLKGGRIFEAKGFGKFWVPNITPDKSSGIGYYTAPELGRVIRYGVTKEGKMGMTMVGALGDMTDDDLEAVVSYIMSMEPVSNVLPEDEPGLMFKVMMAWMFDPEDFVPSESVIPGPAPSLSATIERGKYLANGPANCVGCHTPIDMFSFKRSDQLYSGGNPEPNMTDPSMEYCAPNLTPDEETGIIAYWSEEQFFSRFQKGRNYKDSNMPWEAFKGMEKDDVLAIYQYLNSLKPINRYTGPSYRVAGWKPPVK